MVDVPLYGVGQLIASRYILDDYILIFHSGSRQ